MFPVKPKLEPAYSQEDFDSEIISDFSGGLNNTDSEATVPKNEFSVMSEIYFNRKAQLYTRPQYRPMTFSVSIQDKPITFDTGGNTYVLSQLDGQEAFRQDVTGWSYDGELHVVWGRFVWTTTTIMAVTVYCLATETWKVIWSSPIASNTGVSVVSYEINQAFDLIIFPDTTNPERWTPDDGSGDGTLSDLGLEPPEEGGITDTLTWQSDASGGVGIWDITFDVGDLANIEVGEHIEFAGVTGTPIGLKDDWNSTIGITVSAISGDTASFEMADSSNIIFSTATITHDHYIIVPAQVATGEQGITIAGTYYYKYTFEYDDQNATTKFGESSTQDTPSAVPIPLATSATPYEVSINMLHIPGNVIRANIYRSPPNKDVGPYKLVGFALEEGTPFIDNTPNGQEGVEPPPDGTNPSADPTLAVLHVRNLSGYLVGFDSTMPYKLIWCDAGSPDVWNPLNFDYLNATGKIAIEFNRTFYAFTETSVYQKATMGDPAFKISNIGTIDGNSVQDIGHGLMWMDYDTVYFADFVQQYGSKGDFPRDDGHNVSSSIEDFDADQIISSAFFERRYFLTYYDKVEQIRKTLVYDVDINAWTQHSMTHETIVAGRRKLYSIGTGDGKEYVYEHDYYAIAPVTSSYDGTDYHDYLSVTEPDFANPQTIIASIRKGSIHIGGEFRKIFVSSVSLMIEGTYVNANVTVASASDSFSTSRTFTKSLGTSVIEDEIARWDEAVWAAGSPPADADTTEQGWAGESEGYDSLHKKFKRLMKSNRVNITMTNTDSRDLKILGIAVYYKLLPIVA